ncbi:hypothetical protein BCR32DRAFT_267896 [Anaeromyces robustus]|uniref:Ataxin-10 homolog n=1 Tax=Anaeromyces robustus TaxID=1754192 RepID=A0A1Y1X8G6_9FUNG|nr:hypothetical protein BCR32DRAFT_267896 [Anaeromyces robustus]|eukprot:ORX82061.1 hypothetical protein BCR32DRAFT_267896 [Anaeromyces robustus]
MCKVLINWDTYKYNKDKLREWKLELINLEKELRDNNYRESFKSEKEIWKLFSVVLKWINKNDKINSGDDIIYIEILESIFKVIRNANGSLDSNQLNTKEFVLDEIFITMSKCIELLRKDVTNKQVSTCIQFGIQCIANSFTGNPYIQNNCSEALYDSKIFRNIFDFEDDKLQLYTIMTINNILYNNSTAVDIILKNDNGQEILKRIISFAPMFKDDDKFDFIFVIFKNIMNLDKLSLAFNALAPIQDEELGSIAISREQVIFLKFIDAFLEDNKNENDEIVWEYPKDLPDVLAVLFKRVVSSSYKIISDNKEGNYSTADTDGLILLLIIFGNLVSVLNEEEKIRLSNLGFVEDLITLLKNANELQPRLRKLEDKANENSTWFMFKSDIITVISGLAYNCKHIQDEIRELGGLPLVLANCNIDNNNPYIKERSVFAIRNLCQNNPENQKIIDSLEAKGVDKSTNLDEMGIDAEIDENGKLQIKRIPKKEQKKEQEDNQERIKVLDE